MTRRKQRGSRHSATLILAACLVGLCLVAYFSGTSETPAARPDTAGTLPTDTEQQAAADYNELERMACPTYESARGAQVIKHVGYTLAYDADFKTPQWVAWVLTDREAEGTLPRHDHFAPDPEVRGAKAYPDDYKYAGYDRGHMAPAADMKWSERAMRESFYMTNICPQNRNLNRGDWQDLEEAERSLARRFGAVAITAGPIYSQPQPPRIGAHKVAVPDAFFKVLLVGYPQQPQAFAYVMRNEAGSRPLSYYQHTVNEVEELTGMDFFPGLDEDVEAAKPHLPPGTR